MEAVKHTNIIRVKAGSANNIADVVAVEDPLEIRLLFGAKDARLQQSISVTMRTPGHDFDLAIGFLFTEGIIQKLEDVTAIKHCGGLNENVVRVELREDVPVNMNKLERNFYTTSSCGVCGKASIDAVRTVRSTGISADVSFQIEQNTLLQLPDVLRKAQDVFEDTGGLHGCALFSAKGDLILSREDVGRHNAVDKLIGAGLQQKLFPLSEHLLLLSGRASFELIQKAWMAGIPAVAAVGAPSSLAIELAAESGMTLVGFLRNGGFNIYSGAARIFLQP